jgi:GT2 family glycosyltransferase
MITTILQLYKRPEYLKEQLEAIKKQTIESDKIIVVQNEGNLNVEFDVPENVQFVYANPNMKFHLRFAVGLLVDTEYLSFLDDDTMPQPGWYQNCIETIKKHECICGTNGRIVDRANRRQFGPGWSNPSDNEVEVDFVGHAWFLKKKNLKYMWFDDVIEFNNGEDIQLSANAQIFGNIPTFVPPHPILNKSIWGSLPEKAMKYGCDSVSSWIVNPSHNEERFNLFNEYVKRGWRLILEK